MKFFLKKLELIKQGISQNILTIDNEMKKTINLRIIMKKIKKILLFSRTFLYRIEIPNISKVKS